MAGWMKSYFLHRPPLLIFASSTLRSASDCVETPLCKNCNYVHSMTKIVKSATFSALPGEGGGPGAGSSRREAAAGRNPHGQGGSSAQQPPSHGSGKLPQRPTGQTSTGTHTHTKPRRDRKHVDFALKAVMKYWEC